MTGDGAVLQRLGGDLRLRLRGQFLGGLGRGSIGGRLQLLVGTHGVAYVNRESRYAEHRDQGDRHEREHVSAIVGRRREEMSLHCHYSTRTVQNEF